MFMCDCWKEDNPQAVKGRAEEVQSHLRFPTVTIIKLSNVSCDFGCNLGVLIQVPHPCFYGRCVSALIHSKTEMEQDELFGIVRSVFAAKMGESVTIPNLWLMEQLEDYIIRVALLQREQERGKKARDN